MMHYAREFQTWNLFEYKLVLEPDIEIVKSIKLELEEQPEYRFTTQYEIVLVSFQAKEEMESTLVRWLEKICNLQGSFPVMLNNFGGRPPHNIHIRIQDQKEIKKMINQFRMIDHFIQSNDCPPAVLIQSPQLDIINNLAENNFSKVLRKFSARCFHESFTAEKIKLFRKNRLDPDFRLAYAFTLPSGSRY
jgi:hypothetical protein